MEDLLRHVPGYSFQMKDLSRMVKNWQKSAQHAVVTTYVYKLAEVVRAEYRNRAHNPVDPCTTTPEIRREMIRALWNHNDGESKRKIAFRMWYPVAKGIDWSSIWEPPASATAEEIVTMRELRSYLWNMFMWAMDDTMTLRLLARELGIPNSTIKDADQKFFRSWRNLDKRNGFRSPPSLANIPIAPGIGCYADSDAPFDLHSGLGYEEED